MQDLQCCQFNHHPPCYCPLLPVQPLSLFRLFTESLSSTPQGTPVSAKLTGTPSTPSHVLRERNVVLREKLREKEDWLNDWQREMESLKEFHRLEIKTLEESFDGRVAALTDDVRMPWFWW